MPPPLTPKRTRLSINRRQKLLKIQKKLDLTKRRRWMRNKFEYAGADTKVFNALSFLENEFLKVKIESSVQKQITDHFSQVPSMDTDDIMELCKSLEKSDLSEINLHNQEMCSSCDENHVGVFKCVECDDILCQRCYKAHGRLKVTKTHVVTPL